MLTFPYLDETYLQQLAEHFRKVHPGKHLDLDAWGRVFAHIGFRPALMKGIVKAMSAEGMVDVDLDLRRFVEDDHMVAGWQALFEGRDRVEQLTLIALANGLAPTSKNTVDMLARMRNSGATLSKIRTALARLRKAGILAKPGTDYRIEDPLFADYLAGIAPLQNQAPSAERRISSKKR